MTRNVFLLPWLHLDPPVALGQRGLVLLLVTLPLVGVTVGLVLIVPLAPPAAQCYSPLHCTGYQGLTCTGRV